MDAGNNRNLPLNNIRGVRERSTEGRIIPTYIYCTAVTPI
jgi:hypothetical protein